jgi:hypothetical protein
MRGASRTLVMLVLAACALSPLPPTVPGRLVRAEDITISANRHRLTVSFVGARPFSRADPCSADYTGSARAVGAVLEVSVVEQVVPGRPAIACDAIGFGRTLALDLPEPFFGSTVRDVTGYTHFVSRPDGLVELRQLPAGWELRSEEDVPESTTGRWRRTYMLPGREAVPGGSRWRLDVYQAFDGPVEVSGGEDVGRVHVNGQAATLYRHAPTRELVLVWALDGDGLALVANQEDISEAELIAIAESAVPPPDC